MTLRTYDIVAALNQPASGRWRGIVALAVLAVGWQSQAIVIGTASPNPDGSYTYSYTIDNRFGTFDVISMSLEFAVPAFEIDWDQLDAPSGGGVSVPNLNWIAQAGFPTLGLSSQDFFSLVPLSDVRIGEILPGFSFVSRHRPGNIDYYIEYGSRSETETGFTLGPVYSPVPVPDAVGNQSLLLAAACTCLGLFRRGREPLDFRCPV